MAADGRIAAIAAKVAALVKEQARLRKEHADLQAQLARSEAERAALATQVQDLMQLVGILKVAAGNMNDKEKKEFEKQINRFVRDIDKTIAYLGT